MTGIKDNRPVGVFKPRRDIKLRQNKDCIHYRIEKYTDLNGYKKRHNFCAIDKESPKRTCGWLRKNDKCLRKLRRYTRDRSNLIINEVK